VTYLIRFVSGALFAAYMVLFLSIMTLVVLLDG
jgi:hypothetical protein